MSDTIAAHVQAPAHEESQEPRVSDTYALVYSFILLFLVPGSIAIGQLPFRTYTFQYVGLVTIPFVMGLVLTFLTDSRDSLRTKLIRIAVLTPIVLLSGVAVMFTSSLLLVPINTFLGPEYRTITTPIAGLLLVGLVSPLVLALFRRLRGPHDLRSVAQSAVIASALVLAALVVYVSVWQVGTLGSIARKDIVIYIIGGLVWYAPAMGLSAGIWRRTGLV